MMSWGMSDKLGPIAFGERNEEIFLGRDIVQHSDYSEQTAQMIDAEVKRLVDEAYARAKEILEKHIDVLHAMAAALLERETLNAEEVLTLLDGGTLKPLEPSVEAVPKPAESTKPAEADEKPREFPGGIPPLADPDPTA